MLAAVTLPHLGSYTPRAARDRAFADATARFIAAHGARAFGRDPLTGHVTASAFVISPDRNSVLLMHHAKLDRWLQMGGHCDGNADVRAVAMREAREETGLTSIGFVTRKIIDIDVHEIPARGGEPAHLHHDIRFLMTADPSEPIRRNHESRALAWIPLKALETYSRARSILVLRDRLAEIR